MSRSNRRREDETKPTRRRHDERERKLRPDDPLAKAQRGRAGDIRDDDRFLSDDEVDFDDDDTASTDLEDDDEGDQR
ncbi:MAG TPA: hypothetical protein P5571_07840 [Candidatus Krumholzibacteria bacterium]|nr:hypothetical protein [Candidatus Krumholzibacteria bacterium]HRX51255.1 hypothetical protein [Candidatus Krumholzibacteria bacterium]